MPAVRKRQPEPGRIAVLDETGKELLFWADEEEAHELIQSGLAEFFRTDGGRTRSVKAKSPAIPACAIGTEWLFRRHWPSPFDLILAQERRDLLDECSDALSLRHRQLLKFRYGRDLTFVQIALAFQVTKESVIEMHARALESAREKLTALHITKLTDLL